MNAAALKKEYDYYKDLLAQHEQAQASKICQPKINVPNGSNILLKDKLSQSTSAFKKNESILQNKYRFNGTLTKNFRKQYSIVNNVNKIGNLCNNHYTKYNKLDLKSMNLPNNVHIRRTLNQTHVSSSRDMKNHIKNIPIKTFDAADDKTNFKHSRGELSSSKTSDNKESIKPVDQLKANTDSQNLMKEIIALTMKLKHTSDQYSTANKANVRSINSVQLPCGSDEESKINIQAVSNHIPEDAKSQNIDHPQISNKLILPLKLTGNRKTPNITNKKLICKSGSRKIHAIAGSEMSKNLDKTLVLKSPINTFLKGRKLSFVSPIEKCASKNVKTTIRNARRSSNSPKVVLSKYKVINKKLFRMSVKNPNCSKKVKCFQDMTYVSSWENVQKKYRKNNIHEVKNRNLSVCIRNTPRKITKSKYKMVKKNSPSKLTHSTPLHLTDFKNISFNSPDVDLILELKNMNKSLKLETSSLLKPRLQKRLFKSKNTIINKNGLSTQAKVAKMIKTKYFAPSRKSYSNHIPVKNIKYFQGYHKKYIQRPSHSNVFCRKSARYGLTTQEKVWRSKQNILGKYNQRSSTDRRNSRNSFYRRVNVPVSQATASRVLHRSINRVLTASAKKNVSKINTYCMFYNRFGRCNKSTKCSYVHDPSKIAVCTRFLRGTCKTKNCPFSHEICPGKMAICSFYLLGKCTRGDCPYRHEELSSDAEMCKNFVQGYCSEGKQCKKAHLLVCLQFLRGDCPKGDTCPFPHAVQKNKIVKNAQQNETSHESDAATEKGDRYFLQGSDISGEEIIVVKRGENLSKQPSFISLSLSETIDD